jgi:hypothetical protein
VGALLTWRRPGHPVGWILAATGLVEAVDFATFEYGLAASAGHSLPGSAYAGWVQLWIWVPFVTLVAVYLFLLFPDGRLPSPRLRLVSWLAGGFAVIAAAGLAFSPGSDRPNLPGLTNPFGVVPAAVAFDAAVAGLVGLVGCVVLAAWSLLSRSRRGTAVQRHQVKWLAWSACLVAVALVPAVTLSLTPGTTARLLATEVFKFHSTVAVAAATLAAAALFNPVRRRVQNAVDQRFNRARYDADQTVTAFAARLKDAVDLDSIRDDLASVVHRALEPAHISVWISRRD